MNNFKLSKSIWKAGRIVIISAASFLIANIQNWIPPEYATPFIIGFAELVRNIVFGNHNQSVFSLTK